MAPTKRSLASTTENIPSKKIKHAGSSRAPHQTLNVDHLRKPTMLLQHENIALNKTQDLQCSSTSNGYGTPKKVWTPLKVCSLSNKENNNAQVLPEDVEIEILARLPVQSLLRFRCVSKSWCAIIKSPTFIQRHLRQQKDSVLLVRRCLRRQEDKDVFSFHNPDSPNLDKLRPNVCIPFVKDFIYPCPYTGNHPYRPGRVCVLGPCNGLVCIGHVDNFILCNPALREFKLLPACPYAPPPVYMPTNEGHGFGLTSDGDFKVVLIRPVHDKRTPYILVYVYSSRINAWRKIHCDSTVVARNFYRPLSHVLLNGACHWFAFNMETKHERRGNFPAFVLSLDINTDVIRRFELPNSLKYNGILGHRKIENINERLAAFRYCSEGGRVELWVMTEYGVEESWTKQYVIRHSLTIPILAWKNGEQLLSVMSIGQLDSISAHLNGIKINGPPMRRNGQLASIAAHPDRMKGYKIYGLQCSFRVLLYEESLISVSKVIC